MIQGLLTNFLGIFMALGTTKTMVSKKFKKKVMQQPSYSLDQKLWGNFVYIIFCYIILWSIVISLKISGNRSIIIRTVNINKIVVSLPQPSYRAAQHNQPLQPCNSTQPQLCNSPRPYSQQQLSLMLLLAPAVRHRLLCLSGR